MLLSRSTFTAFALLVSTTLFQHVSAQVTTDCNPLNSTCPADPALGTQYNFNFNQTPADGAWETTAGSVIYDGDNGATFTINKQGDSPTIRTNFYIFWGRVELWMKCSPGTGIISSAMFLSDDLDEIDWEFMGGNSTHAETNYFGKGHEDYHNAIYYPVDGGVQADYHNYTTVWTNESLIYYIDGNQVRTLLPADANNTHYYPQTPMRLSLGIWAGGDPTLPEGTREWAGGNTNYSQGPFNMYVKSAFISDYSQGKEYTYGDMSGSWQSIKVTSGNSTVLDQLNATPSETLSEKWNNLSPTVKIAIYASAAGVGAILFIIAVFYCIRQRRRGARQARLAEAQYEADRREVAALKEAGIDPDSFAVEGTEYDAKEMSGDSYNSPTGSSAIKEEKWGAAAAVATTAGTRAGAAELASPRSPMPLLRDGTQSPRMGPQSPQMGSPQMGSPRMGNPRMGSPGPNGGNPAYDRSLSGGSGSSSPAYPLGRLDNAAAAGPAPQRSPVRTPGPMSPMASPMRTASPGFYAPQPQQRFSPQPNRSFSNPNTQMRMNSPGPQIGGGGYDRMQSPAQMPQPQRSFTSGGYGGGGGGGGGGSYGGGRSGGGRNEGYWGTGGYM